MFFVCSRKREGRGMKGLEGEGKLKEGKRMGKGNGEGKGRPPRGPPFGGIVHVA